MKTLFLDGLLYHLCPVCALPYRDPNNAANCCNKAPAPTPSTRRTRIPREQPGPEHIEDVTDAAERQYESTLEHVLEQMELVLT